MLFSHDNAEADYLYKKLVGMQQRLNITDEHIARLLDVDLNEWKQIKSLGEGKRTEP